MNDLREGIAQIAAAATDGERAAALLACPLSLLMTCEGTIRNRMLAAGFPEANGKPVVLLRELAGESGDIADPAAQGEDVFQSCRDEIVRCLEIGLPRLLEG